MKRFSIEDSKTRGVLAMPSLSELKTAGLARLIIDPLDCFPGYGGWMKTVSDGFLNQLEGSGPSGNKEEKATSQTHRAIRKDTLRT